MAIIFRRVPDIDLDMVAAQPTVIEAAEAVASVYDFDAHPYFVWMQHPETTRAEFRESLIPYRYFVEHFSRALTAVLARIPAMTQRLTTVFENVQEEHGHGHLDKSHRDTFNGFLASIGVEPSQLEGPCPIRVAVAYEALLNFCLTHPAPEGAAAVGIVEYTHILISDILLRNTAERGWGNIEEQHHYSFHRGIDTEHSRDLFAVCDEVWVNQGGRQPIAYAMGLGVHYWWSLFADLCPQEPAGTRDAALAESRPSGQTDQRASQRSA